jgi:hypothetical protein
LYFLGDVYLLGATNSGKSTLYNQLKISDYCEPIASDALTKSSCSRYPKTTLGFVQFPINYVDNEMLKIRTKRLEFQRQRENEENIKRYETRRQKSLSQQEVKDIYRVLTAREYIGNSFKKSDYHFSRQEYLSAIDKSNIQESNNNKNKNSIMLNARKLFRYKDLKEFNCVFDTPGIMLNGEPLM